MIDFSLTEEQKRFLALAREFSANEIMPVALAYDRDGTYPEAILKKAHELGLMYTNIPEEYGGSGMDYVTHYVVTEALNYDCCAIGQTMGISHLATAAILLGGTDEQKTEIHRHHDQELPKWLLLPDRTRGRLRRRGHADRCRTNRGWVCHQWF